MVERSPKPWLAAAAAGLVPLFIAGAAAAKDLSVAAAAARATEENPSVRAHMAAQAGASAQAEQARSRLLPRLDARASLTRTNHPVLAFGALLAQGTLAPEDLAPDVLVDPEAVNDVSARLDLVAPLFDVASWYALRAAASGRDAAEAELRAQRAAIIASTVTTYFSAKVADARREIARSLIESAERDVERAKAMLETEMANITDVAELETELAGLKENAIIAEGHAEIARAELARLVGLPLGTELTLTTPLESRPPAINVAAPLASDHPVLAAAEAQVKAAEAAAQGARWSYAPTLLAHGSLEHHAAEPFNDGGHSYTAGITLSWNLFAGLGDRAGMRSANASAARARAMRDGARSELEVAVHRARRAVVEADARLEVSEKGLAFARETHRQIRDRHASGMAVTNHILRARSALLAAEERHLQALSARHAAAVGLAAALGTLDRGWPQIKQGKKDQ